MYHSLGDECAAHCEADIISQYRRLTFTDTIKDLFGVETPSPTPNAFHLYKK